MTVIQQILGVGANGGCLKFHSTKYPKILSDLQLSVGLIFKTHLEKPTRKYHF
jgi:hypothetical protein